MVKIIILIAFYAILDHIAISCVVDNENKDGSHTLWNMNCIVYNIYIINSY